MSITIYRLFIKLSKLLFIFVVLFFCFFQIDSKCKNQHLKSVETTQNIIDDLIWENQYNPIKKVGSSQKNITPNIPVRIAGYGIRREFKGVHDSLFVRSVVFIGQQETTAIVSLDLLLITPNLAELIKESLTNLKVDNVYLTATHSHGSFGGYGKNLVGSLFLGGNNEVVVNNIVIETAKSVSESLKGAQNIKYISYSKTECREVKNRLNKERNTQEYFRNIFIDVEGGKRINLMSFNAHPTIVAHDETLLSNGYPGELCKQNKNDFSMFMAGTMGSVTPIIHKGKTPFDKTKEYAKKILNQKLEKLDTTGSSISFFKTIKLPMPKLSLYINKKIQIRNWVFSLIFGEVESYIDVFRMGKILMVGLPVELSSEYYEELQDMAASKDLKLVMTSFNGTYLGYATPSKHFHINHPETREMNWTGKFGGDYFKEVIRMIIEKQ